MLAVIGVGIVIVAVVLGLFAGELVRTEKDPELRKQLEEERRERERRQAWKDKWK